MEQQLFRIPLLNYPFKIIGLLLVLISLLCGYLYFLGGRPTVFEIPVFAIVSSYMESRFFVIAKTNILDELCGILLIGGMVMIAFSKERIEQEEYFKLRVKALIYAVYATSALWMVIFLLVYGWVIFIVSAAIFLFFLISYYLLFRYLVFKWNRGVETGQHGTNG